MIAECICGARKEFGPGDSGPIAWLIEHRETHPVGYALNYGQCSCGFQAKGGTGLASHQRRAHRAALEKAQAAAMEAQG